MIPVLNIGTLMTTPTHVCQPISEPLVTMLIERIVALPEHLDLHDLQSSLTVAS